jgi:hypothetical protein
VPSARYASIATLLLACAGVSAARADEALLAAVEDCRARLDVQVDVGYARIAARCPRLVRALEASEWRAWLPPGWRAADNDLSIGGLEELAVVIGQESLRETAGRRPGTSKLRQVLIGLEAARTPRLGPWGRFRQWLERVLERRTDDDPSAWLDRLPQRGALPAFVLETITYLALGLVIVLAVLIVANELRLARVFRRRARAPRDGRRASRPSHTPLGWHDVERAPPAEKPAVLLRLVLERMMQGGSLPAASSLTVREIESRAALRDPEDRARLAALTAAAEHGRFAGRPVERAALESALAAGSQLLRRLQASRAAS